MKKILIAGANGYIGSYLSNELSSNFRITRISLNPINSKIVKVDLTDRTSIEKFVSIEEKFDVLIFLVGLAHKKGKNKEINDFRNINFNTLKNLMSCLSKKNKVPLQVIFASTVSVYGEKNSNEIIFEESSLKPKTPYSLTKKEAEDYLLKNFNLSLWILRLAPVYSKSFKTNIDRRTKFKNFNYKIGKGLNRLSLCNMKNIEIVISSIIKGNIPQGVYNICDYKTYTFKDLHEIRNKSLIIRIPKLFIWLIYKGSELLFLDLIKDNCIKLLTDSVYSSKKIRKYVSTIHTIEELKEN